MQGDPLDIFGQMFKGSNGVEDVFGPTFKKEEKKIIKGLFCNKCDEPLKTIEIIASLGKSKKMFYCKDNRCERFGLLTVVAKTSKLE